jgi:hypothetical protein
VAATPARFSPKARSPPRVQNRRNAQAPRPPRPRSEAAGLVANEPSRPQRRRPLPSRGSASERSAAAARKAQAAVRTAARPRPSRPAPSLLGERRSSAATPTGADRRDWKATKRSPARSRPRCEGARAGQAASGVELDRSIVAEAITNFSTALRRLPIAPMNDRLGRPWALRLPARADRGHAPQPATPVPGHLKTGPGDRISA